jgi:putative transposase
LGHGDRKGTGHIYPSAPSGLVTDWRSFLASGLDEGELALLRRHECTGRPLGDESFVTRLERMLGRVLRRQKPGPKPSQKS